MKLKLRRVWLMVHRWLGLTVGLLFAFAGLTGSVIVFDHAIDEWLNSAMMVTRHEGSQRSVAEIIAAAEQAAPAPGRIVNVHYPRIEKGTFTLHFRDPQQSNKAETTEVFVDPITAEVLGQRVRDSGLMAAIYRLHSTLLAGDTGKGLLGGLALLSLVSISSGLVLWWPLIRRGIRIGIGIRSGMVVYDLHKSLGGLFSPILLLIVVTGVYLTLPKLVKPLITAFSKETKLPTKVKSKPREPGMQAIGPDAAAQVAQQTMPGCRLMSIELPLKADDAYRVFVRQSGEVGELRGVGRVWVDQYQGNCLATRDWRTFTIADTYFRIQLALHSGDAFGLLGRWLFCLAGLVPSVLYVTGFIMWRRRSKLTSAALSIEASRNIRVQEITTEIYATAAIREVQ
jgi:uncharacterized iron-regulated membrane protein